MRITARVDYAVRAMTVLATAADETPVKAEVISAEQDIPWHYETVVPIGSAQCAVGG